MSGRTRGSDFVVVGAGIVGCAVARTLAGAGASVVVIDPDQPGRHASWAAAGMLAPQAESDGRDALLPLLLRAREYFTQLVPRLREETGLDVDYSTAGMLLVAFDESESSGLERRYAWQVAEGLEVERLTGEGARNLEPLLAPNVVSALRFPNDHRVDNRQLTRALWLSAAREGARFRSGARVSEVVAEKEGVTIVLEDGEHVGGAAAVIAAGSWSGTIRGIPTPLPVEPVHGQLIGIQTESPLMRHAVGSARGYIVPRSDGRVIAGTTVERIGFRKAVTPRGLRRIADIAMEIVPELGERPVLEQWSGLRPGTPDGWPILGADPAFPHLFYATGHFRNGILLGPLSGEAIADLALGRDSPIDLTPFRPDRFGSS